MRFKGSGFRVKSITDLLNTMRRRDSSLPLRMTNALLTSHPEWNEGFRDGTLYSVTLSGAKGLILINFLLRRSAR
ncbi:MAG: hypothetical protein E3K32_11160 [wastewater metagenome]|nr:hypothetical protein [Candidatus Loosdrechtia aerotolerans]